MKRLFLIFLLLTLTNSYAADANINAYGYGPVLAGMTIAQAEKRLGTKLISENQSTDDPFECDYYRPANPKIQVHFMVTRGTIAHVEVRLPSIATDTGIKVGDPASKVIDAYGKRIEIKPNAYTDGFYYFVWDIKEHRGLKFEIEDGNVYAIYGGSESITYVEGCA